MSSLIPLNAVREALHAAIHPEDRLVIVHSGLWAFGHRVDADPRRLPEAILDALLEAVGPQRTLVLPTFALDYPRTRTYDVVRTRPQAGILGERLLARPGAIRTLKPMYNYAVLGPEKDAIQALRSSDAWGADSFMGYARRQNARFVALGLPWSKTCAYYHNAEAELDVPYRYGKRFAGTLLRDGQLVGPCEEVFFVRAMDASPEWTYDDVFREFQSRGQVMDRSVGDMSVLSGRLGEVLGTLFDLVEADPYTLVANRNAVEAWVRTRKDSEMASLAPESRPQAVAAR